MYLINSCHCIVFDSMGSYVFHGHGKSKVIHLFERIHEGMVHTLTILNQHNMSSYGI